VLEHEPGVDEVVAAGGQRYALQVGLDDVEALGAQRLEEADVGVERGDARAALGERDRDAPRARAGLQALPARGQPETVAQCQRATVLEGGEALEPGALGVPGRVEGVAGGGEGRCGHAS
jgi:hypothetical protein